MQRSVALLLLCIPLAFGCGPRYVPPMYIYSTETFWYVMQEQALFFNKIYGTQIRLIPVRAERTESAIENGIDITADHHAPRPWRFMEEREVREEVVVPRAQLHPDI